MKKKKVSSSKNQTLKITIYLLLRGLVFISMIGQALNQNWNNVLLCIITLILFTFPSFISKKFNITFPEPLEIIVYIFIFSAEILGEIQNFYGIFTHWDTILHTLNGFLCGAIGFSLVDILNSNENIKINMSPAFAALVAFSFSMTVGIMWEFCEYSVDRYFKKDMQKDRIIDHFQSVKINPDGENIPLEVNDITKTEIYYNKGKELMVVEGGYLDIGLNDTMKDLFVNFLGALVFSIFGYLYVLNRDEYRFIERWIPRKEKKQE